MKCFMAIFRVTSPIDVMCQPNAHWPPNNKHNVYKQVISLCFLQLLNIFCSHFRLRMHLANHLKMKSAIVMILLAMVAFTQAKRTGMNNIYGGQSTAFSLLKNILTTV